MSEGQSAETVNHSARAIMASIVRRSNEDAKRLAENGPVKPTFEQRISALERRVAEFEASQLRKPEGS